MKYTIPIDAVPQERPRVNKNTGCVYDPAKSKKFKTDFARLFKAVRNDTSIYSGVLRVRIDIFRPKSKFRKGVTSKKYGDWDNLGKPITDALNGVLWTDDSILADVRVVKHLATDPYVVLDVEVI